MIVTEARGKLGGHVFTKVRSGSAVRTRITPVNRRSKSQGLRRNWFATFARQWSTDATIDHEAWNDAALNFPRTNVFGDLYALSGKNLYISLNANLALIFLPRLLIPPAHTEPNHIADLNALYSGNPQVPTLAATMAEPDVSDVRIVVEATRPHNIGRFTFTGQFVMIENRTIPTQVVNWDFATAYLSVFPPPPVGSKIALRLWVISQSTGIATAKRTVTLYVSKPFI